ncbi:MAG TPA: hypothetical protein VL380_05585 [Nitrosospira sp.]|nr:hypothetical protein [Nitrosospira sp.]
MPSKNPIERPTVNSIDSYVKKHASHVGETQEHQHPTSETIREADYEGHHIVIRTTYQIEVDGKPVTGHMGVTDDGKVHYHPVPNISFASALDMVKQLINIFPDDFNHIADKSTVAEEHATPAHEGHATTARARAKRTSTGRRVKKTHTDH